VLGSRVGLWLKQTFNWIIKGLSDQIPLLCFFIAWCAAKELLEIIFRLSVRGCQDSKCLFYPVLIGWLLLITILLLVTYAFSLEFRLFLLIFNFRNVYWFLNLLERYSTLRLYNWTWIHTLFICLGKRLRRWWVKVTSSKHVISWYWIMVLRLSEC
jgi:hypothetical protein